MVAGTDDAVATVVEAGKAEPVESELVNKTAQEESVQNETMEMPAGESVAEDKPSEETGPKEPARVNFTEAAKADAAEAAESANLTDDDKPYADENNGYNGIRKPLFSRFNPRGSMVFNRNGFPRKNADLRVALSELQKTAETKVQGNDANPKPQNDAPQPEGNKEA